MTGIEERVKGFLESWRESHCAKCQGLLSDGDFIMIEGRLYCLDCHDGIKNDTGTLNHALHQHGTGRVGFRAGTENGHGHE